MSYKILKLKSGEELISHVTEKNKRTIVLTRPMVFRTTTLMDKIGRPYDMTLLKDWLIHTTSQQIEIPKTCAKSNYVWRHIVFVSCSYLLLHARETVHAKGAYAPQAINKSKAVKGLLYRYILS
jgi:hypothetical protein